MIPPVNTEQQLLDRGESIARSEKEDGRKDQWAWGDWANDVAGNKDDKRLDERLAYLHAKLTRLGHEIPSVSTLMEYRRVSVAWPSNTRNVFGVPWTTFQVLSAQPDRYELIHRHITATDARDLVNRRNMDAVAATEYVAAFTGGEVVDLPLDSIVLDDRILPRTVHTNIVDTYANANLDEFPPIDVFQIEGTLYLADGRHRYEANQKQARSNIKAQIFVGSHEDARRHAVRANNQHGYRFTDEENMANFAKEREINPEASEYYIAKVLGIPHATVRDFVAANTVAGVIGKLAEGLSQTKLKVIHTHPVQDEWPLLAALARAGKWNRQEIAAASKNLSDPNVPELFKEHLRAGKIGPLPYDRDGVVFVTPEALADPHIAAALIDSNEALRKAFSKVMLGRDVAARERAREEARKHSPNLVNENDFISGIGQINTARYALSKAFDYLRQITEVDESMRESVQNELHKIDVVADFIKSWSAGTAQSMDEALQAILNEGN